MEEPEGKACRKTGSGTALWYQWCNGSYGAFCTMSICTKNWDRTGTYHPFCGRRTPVRLCIHRSMGRRRRRKDQDRFFRWHWQWQQTIDQRSAFYRECRLCSHGIHLWRPSAWGVCRLCKRTGRSDHRNLSPGWKCRDPGIFCRKDTGITLFFKKDQDRKSDERVSGFWSLYWQSACCGGNRDFS